MIDGKIQKLYEDNGSQEGSNDTVRTIVPRVEIQETGDSYILRLDIPGADKNNIKAQIEEGRLHISAFVDSYFEKDATLLYDDSMPMEYQREFSLANNVDTTAVNAVYELGVLTVILKKKQQFLPKEIAIT
jgi:HSP20 family molecular chaperone IbpA